MQWTHAVQDLKTKLRRLVPVDKTQFDVKLQLIANLWPHVSLLFSSHKYLLAYTNFIIDNKTV